MSSPPIATDRRMVPSPLDNLKPRGPMGTTSSERGVAFREIFDALRSQVFGLCLHITRSRAEAEDALQETFLAVHQSIHQFRGDSKLATWVYRIAVRAALAARSKRRSHASIDEAEHVPSAHASPEDAAHTQKEFERFRRAFDQLSTEHQVVLSLFAVEGLAHEEIAEILGVPAGTVWSRLHLARKRLGALTQSR